MSPPWDANEVVFSRMRWNAPLSEDHAALLLERLDVHAGDHVLDLGCGWGELLMRAVNSEASTTGTGIDDDAWAVEHGRGLAVTRDLAERVSFVHADAATAKEAADRVICVGAPHAFGGTATALRVLTDVVKPGGRLLYGDMCWENPPPSEAAAAIFGDEAVALPDLVQQAGEVGWRVLHLSTADQREWDDFEATWRAGRQEWLLAHPDDDSTAEGWAQIDNQQHAYLHEYRGILGFAYLVLAR
jgi:cyclopropane fatty-acyl-phospholipid synthase-like methyltransferase